MEPPVLFDHRFFGGCDVELEEQRLGLLDELRDCRHRGYRIYLLRPCSRLWAHMAWHSGPGILGASDDFLDNRSTDANQRCDTGYSQVRFLSTKSHAASLLMRNEVQNVSGEKSEFQSA